MPYRHLHFRSLAKDLNLRTEIYNGEEHLVVPCIALVGDEVVYGLKAEGPEFIPAEELEFSTLGWSGRPVLPDHPANSTSTANDPHTLQLMQFGQIFYPRFEDKKLKIEAWLGKERAKKVTGAPEVIAKAENGEMIELSVGAIISLDKQKGVSPSGVRFDSKWRDIIGDHLAIGLSGSQGACNLEMGCGANRTLADNNRLLTSNSESTGESDVRMMRTDREDHKGDETVTVNTTNATVAAPAAPAVQVASAVQTAPAVADKPRSVIQKILSYASRVFRSNTEDEGLSDFDLRSKLWDVLYSIEPAFSGIEDVYQDSKTVRYITNPTFPEAKMFLWRRTFDVAEDGTVTVNDDREEVDFAVNYIYLADKNQGNNKPCGCQTNQSEAAQPEVTVQSKEDNTMADAPKTTTTTPNPDPVPTPESGSSEAGTPSQGGSLDKTTPNYPAGQTADNNDMALTEDEQIEKLPAPLRAMVRSYQERDRKEHEALVGALSKAQKVFTPAQLKSKPVDELRQIAELAGVGSRDQKGGDYSGRMLVAQESELRPPPDPHGVEKYLKRGDAAN